MGNSKFKVNDRVRVKSLEWYNDNKDEYGYIFSHGIYFVPHMTMFCGCVMTINKIDNGSDNIIYYVKENACVWTEDMFEDDDLEFQQAIAKAVDECLWGTDDEFNENKETDTTEKLVDNSVEFGKNVTMKKISEYLLKYLPMSTDDKEAFVEEMNKNILSTTPT